MHVIRIAILMLLGFFLTSFQSVDAKDWFLSKEEMIQQAPYIAIVRIGNVEYRDEPIEGSWKYHQHATATVEKSIKGLLPHQFDLYGGEECARALTAWRPGRFLVFLKVEREKLPPHASKLPDPLFVGVNWHLSLWPIKGDSIKWYSDKQSRELLEFPHTDWQPLKPVFSEIKTLLVPKKPAKLSNPSQ